MTKIIFSYFGKKALCTNADHAIEFINGLHFHGNPHCEKLVVNERTKNLLIDLFNNEWTTEGGKMPHIVVKKTSPILFSRNEYYNGHDIRTTNCRNTSIKMYEPLGGTIEEHEKEYNRIIEERKEQSLKREQEYRNQREIALTEKKEGWYSVSLTYVRTKYPRFNYVESVFSGECIASSGYDAYLKTIKAIEDDGEASLGALYPDAYSSNFCFTFLGTKTDDGYTMC